MDAGAASLGSGDFSSPLTPPSTLTLVDWDFRPPLDTIGGFDVRPIVVSNRLALVTFNLSLCSLCIYGQCGRVVHFVNLTATEIADKVRAHGLSCEMCKHPGLTRKNTRQPLSGDLFLPNGTRSVASKTGVLLPRRFFEWISLQPAMRQCKMQGDAEFCGNCLCYIQPKSSNSPVCCNTRFARRIECVQRKNCDWLPYLETDADIREFYNKREAEIREIHAATAVVSTLNFHSMMVTSPQSAPRLQQSLSSVNISSLSPIPMPSLQQSSPSTASTSIPPPQSAFSSSFQTPFPQPNFNELSPDHGANIHQPTSQGLSSAPHPHAILLTNMGNGVLTSENTGAVVIFDPTNVNSSKILRSPQCFSGHPSNILKRTDFAHEKQQSYADKSLAYNPNEIGTQASRKLTEILWGTQSVSSTIREEAQKCTGPLSSTDIDDVLLTAGVRVYLRFGILVSKEHIDPGILNEFNKALFNYARGEREDQALVALGSGFPSVTGLSHERGMTSQLARLLRCAIKMKVPGIFHVVDGLRTVKAENATIPMTQIADWNLDSLAYSISCFFYQVVIHNSAPFISLMIRPFVFKYKVEQAASGTLHHDSDEDEQTYDGTTSTDGFNTPEFICKLISAVFRACKLAVAWTFMGRVKATDDQLSQLSTSSQVHYVDPFELTKNEVTGSVNLIHAAKLTNQCRYIAPASASPLNACQRQYGEAGETIFHVGSEMIDMWQIRKCKQVIVDGVKEYFLACCNPVDSRQRSEIWEWIMDPNSQEFLIKQVSTSLNQCATLNLNSQGCTLVATQCSSVDSSTFIHDANELRNMIFPALALFMGSVARSPEFNGLTLNRAQGQGNLFLTHTWSNQPTLGFADLVRKTNNEAYTVLPQWLSRIILVLFQIFGPVLARHMVEELNVLQSEDPDADQTWTQESILKVCEEWERRLSTSLSIRAQLSPTFAKKVRDYVDSGASPSHKVSVDDACVNGLYNLEHDQVRELVKNGVARRGLGTIHITFAQLRHVLIQFKTHLPSILQHEADNHQLGDVQLESFRSLHRALKEVSGELEDIQGLASIGMHTALTDVRHYQGHVQAGTRSLPGLKAQSTKICEALITVFFGFPYVITREAQMQGCSSVTSDRKLSVRDELVKGGKLQPGNAAAKEFLLDGLLRISNDLEGWLSPEQEEATFINFAEDSHSLIVTPCGSGKSTTFLLPFKLAPTGFAFVIVPYIALCQTMYDKANAQFPDRCVIFKKNEPEFKSSTFGPGGAFYEGGDYQDVRLVFVVTETAVSNEALMFLQAASNRRLLNAIVIDEAHQVLLSANFRPMMNELGVMFTFGVKVVMLSGTLPPCLESSLFIGLGVRRNSVRIIRKEDSYGERLIVNLLHIDDEHGQRVDDKFFSEHVAKKIVSPRLQFRRNDHRPILVFGLTKASVRSIMNNVQQALGESEFKLVCLTSDSTAEERNNFFEAIGSTDDGKTVIAFSTSAAAEGIDFSNVGTVIVLGGCFGGVLTLHQMMNRAGRGVPNEEYKLDKPEAFFIHSPAYIKSMIQDTLVHDNAIMRFIDARSRPSARALAGFESLRRLQEGSKGVCGGRVMEKLLGGKSISDNCGKCYGCLGENWPGTIPKLAISQMPSSGQRYTPNTSAATTTTSQVRSIPPYSSSSLSQMNTLSSSRTSEDQIHSSAAKRTRFTEQAEIEEREQSTFVQLRRLADSVQERVRNFLGDKAADFCISCKGKCKYPNKCLKTKQNIGWGSKSCYNCFNQGHDVVNFSREVFQNAEVKYNSIKVTRCIELTTGCAEWELHKACARCMLSHPISEDDTRSRECPIKNVTILRHVMIIVWNTAWLKKQLGEWFQDYSVNFEEFRDYTRWVLYKGEHRVQNGWRLIDFFITYLPLWDTHGMSTPTKDELESVTRCTSN